MLEKYPSIYGTEPKTIHATSVPQDNSREFPNIKDCETHQMRAIFQFENQEDWAIAPTFSQDSNGEYVPTWKAEKTVDNSPGVLDSITYDTVELAVQHVKDGLSDDY